MKKRMVVLVSIFLLLLTIMACGAEEGSTKEASNAGNGVFIKDKEGNVLASLEDFLPGSAVMMYEPGIRTQGIEFQFKDARKLEAITMSNLHNQVHFHFGEERLASPVISNVISNGSILIDGGFTVELAEKIVEEINS